MSDLPTPDTSNYDGTFDNEPTYWQLADPLLNDQGVQKWVLPVPDGILMTRQEFIESADYEAAGKMLWQRLHDHETWDATPDWLKAEYYKHISDILVAAYPKGDNNE